MILKVGRYTIIPFRSRLNRQIENMSMERLCSLLNIKQKWYAIVPFPCEQPTCPSQKLERRWKRTIAFPCEKVTGIYRIDGTLGVLCPLKTTYFSRFKIHPRVKVFYSFASLSLELTLRDVLGIEDFKPCSKSTFSGFLTIFQGHLHQEDSGGRGVAIGVCGGATPPKTFGFSANFQ